MVKLFFAIPFFLARVIQSQQKRDLQAGMGKVFR